mmetsp:Transcript_32331/g.50385  ORF Transcript_32331/g.50385 Transcript_32331/m.50385 type:complete len:105 (+) Transcript_32331:435-749(+)
MSDTNNLALDASQEASHGRFVKRVASCVKKKATTSSQPCRIAHRENIHPVVTKKQFTHVTNTLKKFSTPVRTRPPQTTASMVPILGIYAKVADFSATRKRVLGI